MNTIDKNKFNVIGLATKHRHWQKKGVNVFIPRTASAFLRGNKHIGAPALDCTADPCNCTGCSEWD